MMWLWLMQNGVTQLFAFKTVFNAHTPRTRYLSYALRPVLAKKKYISSLETRERKKINPLYFLAMQMMSSALCVRFVCVRPSAESEQSVFYSGRTAFFFLSRSVTQKKHDTRIMCVCSPSSRRVTCCLDDIARVMCRSERGAVVGTAVDQNAGLMREKTLNINGEIIQ